MVKSAVTYMTTNGYNVVAGEKIEGTLLKTRIEDAFEI
jgi:hypothetical protein